jgi:hypothetical protein
MRSCAAFRSRIVAPRMLSIRALHDHNVPRSPICTPMTGTRRTPCAKPCKRCWKTGRPGFYGEADWLRVDGTVIGRYPTRSFEQRLLQSECFICQPASFIRREAFEDAGMLDTSLNYAYDFDSWIRFAT